MKIPRWSGLDSDTKLKTMFAADLINKQKLEAHMVVMAVYLQRKDRNFRPESSVQEMADKLAELRTSSTPSKDKKTGQRTLRPLDKLKDRQFRRILYSGSVFCLMILYPFIKTMEIEHKRNIFLVIINIVVLWMVLRQLAMHFANRIAEYKGL